MDLKEYLKPLEGSLHYLVLVVGLVSVALFVWYFSADSDRRKRVAGTWLAIILVAFSVFCISLGIKKGIDLQGGAAFLVRVQAPEGRQVSRDALEHAQEVIEKRLNPEGTKDVIVTPQGEDRLYVEVPGLSDEEIRESRSIIERPAKLEFRLLHPKNVVGGRAVPNPPGDESIEPGYVKMPYRLKEPEPGEAPPSPEELPTIFVKNRAELLGDSVKNAYAGLPPGALYYMISVELNSEAGKKMEQITAANIGQPMAIILDNVVISAPTIQGKFGASFQITGHFDEKEARELASALENPLQNSLLVEQSSTTSPAYGAEVIKQGIWSAIAGLIATLAFMVFYYRLSGTIAVVGLVVNLLLLLGAMQVFGFTLTMPGIAGIILTLGMAVDANVLIYERLREEFRAGRPLSSAINVAYDKAFSAIFDSNITTLITSIIMVVIATGAIRGFGISLVVGIVASLFSALLITRVCFMWLSSRGLQKLSFLHLIQNRLYDFMSVRKICFVISGVLMAGCLAVVAVKGERVLGYELRGGDSISLQNPGGLTEQQINDSLKDFSLTVNGQTFDATSFNVQTVTPIGSAPYFNIRTAPGTASAILAELKKDLAGEDAAKAEVFDKADIQTMGPAVGGSMLKRSIYALVAGIAGIFIYLSFRFEFPFALGTIVALLHDVVFAIGACALAGKEIGLILVGAFLTIAGYSVNDTIVIFDRVREDLRTMKGDLSEVLNHAISATLSRTVITSGVTALAVLAMFFFGGKSLADFSFAMLAGMISGTYSTIFIASPVVLWWAKKRNLNLRKQMLDAEAARLEAISNIEREVSR